MDLGSERFRAASKPTATPFENARQGIHGVHVAQGCMWDLLHVVVAEVSFPPVVGKGVERDICSPITLNHPAIGICPENHHPNWMVLVVIMSISLAFVFVFV